MSGPASNAPETANRLRSVAVAVRAELAAELSLQAGLVETAMKLEAPKFRSTTANSIRRQRVSAQEWLVRPTTDYAKWVVLGRKPGKGLPRFFDPASAGIVAWLESKLQAARRAVNQRYRRARRGSKRFTAEELELRDRYWMLSRAVKQRGIKPDDFVKRTAEKTGPGTRDALIAAVRRGLAGRGDVQ